MPCYHPLKAFDLGIDPATGHHKIQICKFSDILDTTSVVGLSGHVVTNYFFVPCGKCVGCRESYARDWTARLLLEMEYHESAIFVTLTYNDAHLPLRDDCHTLRKSDVQKFLKRLRNRFPDLHLVYFCSGEYGSKSLRPHYHLILFDIDLPDLVQFSVNKLGQRTFTSKILSDCWSDYLGNDSFNQPIFDPLGFVLVGSVTPQSIAYVARYVNKKMMGLPESAFDSQHGLLPPFVLCSKNPSIGFQYYSDHPELFDSSSLSLDGKSYPIPRYFLKKLALDNPSRYYDLSNQRSLSAALAYDLKSEGGDRHIYLRKLRAAEDNKVAALKSLKRSL